MHKQYLHLGRLRCARRHTLPLPGYGLAPSVRVWPFPLASEVIHNSALHYAHAVTYAIYPHLNWYLKSNNFSIPNRDIKYEKLDGGNDSLSEATVIWKLLRV